MDAQSNSQDRLREIATATKVEGADLVALIAEAYPLLEPFLKPIEWETVYHDLHGFDVETGIEYYEKPPMQASESGHIRYRGMAHRERAGHLVVIKSDGTHEPLKHEIANRKEFIIIAPLAELQRLSREPAETVLVAMPDLTQMIGEQAGGKIALLTKKEHIDEIVANTARALRSFIDLAITPGRREQLDKLQADIKAKDRARAGEA